MNATIWLIVFSILICLSIVIAGIMAHHIRDHWWTWGYFFRVTLKIRRNKDEQDGGAE